MNYTKLQHAGRLLLVGASLISAGVSRGADFWLRAGVVTNTMPDGQAVVMWAFAQDSPNWAVPGALTVPGPQLNVVAGDSLVLHVTNTLPEPVSIIIPGQYGFDSQAPAFFSSGPYAGRARSLNHEAARANGVATYTWNNVQSGTFLYHSGSHPSVQVQMGLYGALAVAAPGPQIYAGVPFNSSATLLLSEVDPKLHAAVTGGNFGPGPAFLQTDFTNAAAFIAAVQGSANPVAQWVAANITGVPGALAADLNNAIILSSIYDPALYPDSILEPTTLLLMRPNPALNQDYTPTSVPFMGDLVRLNRMLLYDGLTHAGISIPKPYLMSSVSRARSQYFMINGQPFTNGQPAIVAGAAGVTNLLRLLNAGMDLRTATLNNGGDLQLVGEDGQQATYPRRSAVVLLPALKTVDALWVPPAQGNYGIYDRHLGLISRANTNLFGGALTFLSVGAPVASPAPAILIPPASQTVPEFSTATFAVVASGSGLTYQWLSNGVAIAGATAPSYSLANVNRTNSGALFSVTVSGTTAPPVTSAGAMLTVTPAAPFIVTQPANTNVTPPGAASMSVVTGGSIPQTFQWFQGPTSTGPFTAVANGGNISGATSSNLYFSATSPANGGFYQVVVTGPVVSTPGVFVVGAGATVTSIPAELRIAPAIPAGQPADVTVADLANATFSVAATGSDLTYQWQRRPDSTGPWSSIPGATNSSYMFQVHYQADNNAHFQVIVSGSGGPSVTSRAAALTVTIANSAPMFTLQPVSVTTNGGATSVSFTAAAYGWPTPAYQWQRFNGTTWVNLTTGGGFSGVNSATLIVESGLPLITLSDAGWYRLHASNTSGSADSSPAGLTVVQTFAGQRVTDIPVGAGGTATPYPAQTVLSVPAVTLGATILHASVTLTLTDPEPFDADMLLAAPDGTGSVQFMAGVGPAPAPGAELPPIGPKYYFYGVTNCTLTFDDAAATQASTNYWLAPGTYQPTVFPMGTNWMTLPLLGFPGSVVNTANTFSSLNGTTPIAGRWRLYVNDNPSDLVTYLPPSQTEGSISSWSLTITAGPPPDAPTPLSPVGSGISTTPAFTFTTVAGATGYQIWLYDGTAWTVSSVYTAAQVDPSNTGTGTITLPTPLAIGDYYWTLTARNAAGVGPAMTGLDFSVGPPLAPTPLSPVGSGISTTPAYTFTTVGGATGYQIWLWDGTTWLTSSWYTPAQVDPANTGTGTITLPTPLAIGNYYWTIWAQNGVGNGPAPTGLYFTVGTPPPAPTPISPVGAIISTTPAFTFNTVAGATGYQIWLWDGTTWTVSSVYTSAQVDPSNTGIGTITLPAPLAIGNYYWTLTARNAAGVGPAMTGLYFSAGVPPAPTPLGPAGSGISTTPAFTFTTVAVATGYQIWLYNGTTWLISSWYTPAQVDPLNTGTGTVTLPAPLAVGNYYWTLTARDAAGVGPAMTGLTFSVP